MEEDRESKYNELHVDGKVVIFTDGASRGSQFACSRFAGIGAYWGDDHPFNMSAPLEGDTQTNNRAEQTAIIKVLQLEVRPLETRTDSQYAIDGIVTHRARWRRNSWANKGRRIRNADLWMELYRLLSQRDANTVLLTKVKGHATYAHVQKGQTTLTDKLGNDAADALAVAGALANHRAAVAQERQEKILLAIQIQRMMLDILAVRQGIRPQAEGAHTDDASSSCSNSSCSSSSYTDSKEEPPD